MDNWSYMIDWLEQLVTLDNKADHAIWLESVFIPNKSSLVIPT
jgi:hypothetical protein